MGKINNTTAYAATAPTADTILIGSAQAGNDGTTHNYLVSALATYMSANITSFTTLSLSGNLTVGGSTILTLDAYDDDAAAAAGGLASGKLYQTTGAGAAPLNAAGIVMVKQ